MRLPSLLLLCFAACGPSSSVDEGLGVIQELDTSEQGITAFVRAGQYSAWLAEPSVHETRAPHGSKVRVFFNDVVERSLRDGNAIHPVGSILVKELFEDDGKTLRGHALDVKIAEGPGKDTWIFYEGFGPDYSNNYYGRAHSTCHGCHSDGKDYVTSPLP
ncbi:hypothetical protein [Corallococcus carmarthensis]|uniref:Cytochrome P460 domain-containing protein n=1 Tax=Corallococcus carmarthensis TaxID=2316728 RepID=A0A3A8KAC1_9BACT|nr:hypothetical protein [Corallococcus carmarthensis]NOK16243.1 hypothetical protein [Corallococcus carmarthensis]RKH04287.1 hypothetical protein D7X32_11460 [Corallococcus carmarthensis]